MPNPLPAEATQCRGHVGCGSVAAPGTRSVGGGHPGSAPPVSWGCRQLCGCSALPAVLQSPGSHSPPQRRRPSSLPTHPRCPRRGGIIGRNHGNPGRRWGCQHCAVPRSPPLPRPRVALRAAGCCQGGGGMCWCPWDAAPTSPGHRDAHGGLAGLQLGLAQQGCICRVSMGCLMSPQGTPWPRQPPPSPPRHGRGFSRDPHMRLLFCSAGMEPWRGPRPAQPTHPLPAAARPGRTLGRGSLPSSCPDTTAMGFLTPLLALPQRGVLPFRIWPSSQALLFSRGDAEPPLWVQTRSPLPPRQWDAHLLLASTSPRPLGSTAPLGTDTPQPSGFTSAPASPSSFGVRQGFTRVTRGDPTPPPAPPISV